jgi:hypothetical protein
MKLRGKVYDFQKNYASKQIFDEIYLSKIFTDKAYSEGNN